MHENKYRKIIANLLPHQNASITKEVMLINKLPYFSTIELAKMTKYQLVISSVLCLTLIYTHLYIISEHVLIHTTL